MPDSLDSARPAASPIRALHLSDLHFGWPAVLEQVDAVGALIADERCDVVVISGDVAQRARAGELQRAAVFLRETQRVSRTIIVPGNHDLAWWFAPFGIGTRERVAEKYRRYISPDLEPVLRVPGATFVGLNTAHGVTHRTLTWNPRDLGVMGALASAQLARAADIFAQAPAGDARIVVMHHNPMRGALSGRLGVRGAPRILNALAAMRADLVLSGHDHQESVHRVVRGGHPFTVAVAGTLSSRSRGGRPGSLHAITIAPDAIEIVTRSWVAERGTFLPTASVTFPR